MIYSTVMAPIWVRFLKLQKLTTWLEMLMNMD